MRALFDHLVQEVERELGTCEVICLPCCIHLAGRSEFAAVLPRKHHLEVRFSLSREIEDARIERVTRTSASMWKHSVHVATVEEVAPALLAWLREADALQDA
jgi:predicted RNA-binding protein with PIN domain